MVAQATKTALQKTSVTKGQTPYESTYMTFVA